MESKSTLSTDKVYFKRKRKTVCGIQEGRLRSVVVFARPFSVYMKIISWNTRGLGSKKKMRIVRKFLSSQNPDIVMF